MASHAHGPDDIHRLIEQLQPVRDRFHDDKVAVIAIYGSVNPKHDARITAYSKAINVLNSVQLAFTFISKHLLNGLWWQDVARSPIPDSDKQIYANEFANFAKIAFVQGIFLAIESSFRLFLRALDPAACNNGMEEFKSIYECLFKSKLKAIPSDGIALLDLLRIVRNTIHNNGVYFHRSGNDASITWNGETFVVKQGVPVDFVTWGFLIRISEALRQLLFEVVEDENLKGISVEINDPFSH
jgi:hypothetical protein